MADWPDDIGKEPWLEDVYAKTAENTTFHTVVHTGWHTQLSVMRIEPGEDIGRKVHRGNDQFLQVVEGQARVELGPKEHEVEQTQEIGPGWGLIVPAGVWHNVVNTGEDDLKLYSLYSPPVHLDGTVHHTKAQAEAAERLDRAF